VLGVIAYSTAIHKVASVIRATADNRNDVVYVPRINWLVAIGAEATVFSPKITDCPRRDPLSSSDASIVAIRNSPGAVFTIPPMVIGTALFYVLYARQPLFLLYLSCVFDAVLTRIGKSFVFVLLIVSLLRCQFCVSFCDVCGAFTVFAMTAQPALGV
jgi:hypothetical protein